MRIDLVEYPVYRCRQIVNGAKVEYLSLGGPKGFAVATGRSRGELLGDFRRRQLEAQEAEDVPEAR